MSKTPFPNYDPNSLAAFRCVKSLSANKCRPKNTPNKCYIHSDLSKNWKLTEDNLNDSIDKWICWHSFIQNVEFFDE